MDDVISLSWAGHWGPRTQVKVVYEMAWNGYMAHELSRRNPDWCSKYTMQRFYDHFEIYGELPFQTKARQVKNKEKM